MDISSKSAIVTGGASGLGLATAERLVALGAHVVLVDLPSSAGAERASELGSNVGFVAADIRDEAQVRLALDAAVARAPLAVTINCAGIGNAIRVVSKSLEPFPLEEFQRVIDVNLVGTFNVLRLAAAQMVAQEAPSDAEEVGVIINTASVAAFDGQVGQAAYAASKGGVVSLTLPLARDLAQHRIRVNTIAPGLFLTPLFQSLSDEQTKALGSQVPHPARLGHPTEFADLVAAIITNPMMNGETLRLDGALRMAPR